MSPATANSRNPFFILFIIYFFFPIFKIFYKLLTINYKLKNIHFSLSVLTEKEKWMLS